MEKQATTHNTRPRPTVTNFSKKWGILASKLAEQEGLTEDAIHMRTYLWGNPFRRSRKPTGFEAKYGFTPFELSLELGIHPYTIETRFARGVDSRGLADPHVMALPPQERARIAVNPETSDNTRRVHNRVLNAHRSFWLHPLHPYYETARRGNLTPEMIERICSDEHTGD